MSKLYFKRKIVIILVSLFLISSTIGANAISINSSIQYKDKSLAINIQGDESLKNNPFSSDNQPPEKPTINGPTKGKAGVELTYTFVSTDPEGHDIVYCLDWGDNSGGICTIPIPSGEEANASHTWDENGTYTITINASDTFGAKSEAETLDVKIPRGRPLYNQLFYFLFERVPLLEKLLSKTTFICGLFK